MHSLKSLDRTFQIHFTAPKHTATRSRHCTPHPTVALEHGSGTTPRVLRTLHQNVITLSNVTSSDNACPLFCSLQRMQYKSLAASASACHLCGTKLSPLAPPATVIHKNATCGVTRLCLLYGS